MSSPPPAGAREQHDEFVSARIDRDMPERGTRAQFLGGAGEKIGAGLGGGGARARP